MIEAEVEALLRVRREELESTAGAGRKIVGYLPGGYVPEELIYASGAIPLCLSHGEARTADEALSTLPSVICPFARAQIGEMLLKTNPFYSALDLLVVPGTCQHMKKIGDVWEYFEGPKVFKLGVPYEHDKAFERDYFRDRLVALKGRLEGVTGNTITGSGLAEAISVYNRLRASLGALSLTRRADRPGISTLDFVRLNHASLYVDPVVMAEALEAMNAGVGLDPGLPAGGERPRVLLMGPNLAFGDYDVLRMAAAAGAEVVVEEIFEGVRDYQHSIATTGDPLEALARGYLVDRRPTAFMRGSSRRRLKFALDLIQEFNVSGVLWYQLLCCEFYDEEAYFFETALRKQGIPMLVIESDYHGLDSGPVRTRLEAFIETMAGVSTDV